MSLFRRKREAAPPKSAVGADEASDAAEFRRIVAESDALGQRGESLFEAVRGLDVHPDVRVLLTVSLGGGVEFYGRLMYGTWQPSQAAAYLDKVDPLQCAMTTAFAYLGVVTGTVPENATAVLPDEFIEAGLEAWPSVHEGIARDIAGCAVSWRLGDMSPNDFRQAHLSRLPQLVGTRM